MIDRYPSPLAAKSRPFLSHLAGLVIGVAMAGAFAPSARATVLWQSDPSLGTSVFEGLEKAPGNISVVSDPQGKYGQVYRYDTWDDSSYAKERCESRGNVLPDGSNFRVSVTGQYYIGWREMWNPMPTQGDWVALFQMHGYGPAGQGAPLVLRCVNGDGNLYMQNGVNGADVNFWKTPFQTGVWHSFVLHIQLSTDPTKGWVEIWYDGVRQTFIDGTNHYVCSLVDQKPGSYVMFKWGVYRSSTVNGKGPASTFMTDAKIGTTYADVDPLGGGNPVSSPTFSPAAGTYSTAQNVTITSATSGVSIRYTTDGSTPGETAGTLYSGPVYISATATLKAMAYKSGSSDSPVTIATYTIKAAPPPTLNFEAESLSYTGSGATTSVQTDTNSSGGKWVELAGNSTGDHIDFTVPNVPAGTYQLKMEWKGNNSRGILQLSVDGTNLGSTLDQYASGQTYPTTTFGNVTFSTTGSHTVRLTVTGKNSKSSSYQLSADKFTFVGQ